jgi:RHS repeat-associated protein
MQKPVKLITENPELLLYLDGTLHITILGGITSYSYDGNGNMLSSANTVNTTQNKSFTYNLLNLPIVSTVATGTATYTYDAAGNKLRKVDVLNTVTTATDYINGIQYGTNSGTTSISFIQTEEGKAVPNGTSAYDYTYYLGDNLGNTRITFDTQTGAVVVQQQDDYYPFGLEINRSVTSPKNEYLYNKKELQEEFQEYDYGARFYDPVIARWTSVDPMAEECRRFSPYNYAENNPMGNIDPDGMSTEDWMKANGITDADLTNVYTAPPDPAPSTENNDSDPGNNTSSTDEPAPTTISDVVGSVLNSIDDGGKKDGVKNKDKNQVNFKPVPQSYKKHGLPGFPGSKLLKNQKGARTSWDLGKGKHCEWDSENGRVEVYDKNRNHVGEFDPETGEKTKDAVPGRRPSYSFQSIDNAIKINQITTTATKVDTGITVGEIITDIVEGLLTL